MWRTLGRPRWLLSLVVLAVVVVGFGRLGLWQLSVAQDEAVERAGTEQRARPVVPVQEVIQPHQPFTAEAASRRVTAQGRYDAARQFLIPDRLLEGRPGYWVVTPLVVDATGARLPVVRGFVPDPAQAGEPATGAVTVTGFLAPGESPSGATALPEGQLASLDLAVLANTWPGALYNAFVFAEAQEPPPAGPGPEPVPPPVVGGEVDWRNLGYALQWWVFAGFAVFMFWRLLREDHLRERPEAPHTLEPSEERAEPHHV